MKKNYETPTLEIAMLENDVISTSGAFNGEEDKIKDKEVNTPIIKF